MGDSGIALQLSLLALAVVVAAIIAFAVAWRVRNRAVRVLLGVLMLAGAAVCTFLSALAALLVAALGLGTLLLATMPLRRGEPAAPKPPG